MSRENGRTSEIFWAGRAVTAGKALGEPNARRGSQLLSSARANCKEPIDQDGEGRMG